MSRKRRSSTTKRQAKTSDSNTVTAPQRKQSATPQVRTTAKPVDKKKESKPKHTPGSLARRKAALIATLKSSQVTPDQQATIRKELEEEPLASTPILSHKELGRLDS